MAATGLGPAMAQDAVPVPEIAEMAIGQADAPVTVIEYASFTCPHCAAFHAEVFGKLKANYIDTGKIRFVYREIYFDRFGLWAAIVARCGGGMRYFGVTDMLFEKQAEWLEGGQDAGKVAENLRRIGRSAGLNDDQLNACLNDAPTAEAMVARFEETAGADGIDSTPSFIIDGQKYSNMGYDEFAAVLDEKLAAK